MALLRLLYDQRLTLRTLSSEYIVNPIYDHFIKYFIKESSQSEVNPGPSEVLDTGPPVVSVRSEVNP